MDVPKRITPRMIARKLSRDSGMALADCNAIVDLVFDEVQSIIMSGNELCVPKFYRMFTRPTTQRLYDFQKKQKYQIENFPRLTVAWSHYFKNKFLKHRLKKADK